jgi:hypothetical protein
VTLHTSCRAAVGRIAQVDWIDVNDDASDRRETKSTKSIAVLLDERSDEQTGMAASSVRYSFRIDKFERHSAALSRCNAYHARRQLLKLHAIGRQLVRRLAKVLDFKRK